MHFVQKEYCEVCSSSLTLELLYKASLNSQFEEEKLLQQPRTLSVYICVFCCKIDLRKSEISFNELMNELNDSWRQGQGKCICIGHFNNKAIQSAWRKTDRNMMYTDERHLNWVGAGRKKENKTVFVIFTIKAKVLHFDYNIFCMLSWVSVLSIVLAGESFLLNWKFHLMAHQASYIPSRPGVDIMTFHSLI